MELFGVGIPELGLVMLIALVIVGPQRFPEVARQIAQWVRTARSFTDAVMQDVRAAVDEIEHEVTAANDGVNPIRELQELRKELGTAANDATSTVTEASTLPPLNDEWAAVAETRATDAVLDPAPEAEAAPVEVTPQATPEPAPAATASEPTTVQPATAQPTAVEGRRADA